MNSQSGSNKKLGIDGVASPAINTDVTSLIGRQVNMPIWMLLLLGGFTNVSAALSPITTGANQQIELLSKQLDKLTEKIDSLEDNMKDYKNDIASLRREIDLINIQLKQASK